ncbi:hypothetical protein [Nocardia lasii]|uniref:DUF2157 domain-containing protein n=1 Tax=Nocardia lasii TaxID=1616107 RepID=A0ABW1JL21_9NOCA
MGHEQRVDVALERLVATGVLSDEQRGAVLRALGQPEPVGRAAEIVAYLGAGLVAAGLGLFVDEAWARVAQSGRVVLLAVVSGSAVWGAVALAGGCAGVFRRVPIASAVRVRLAAVLLALAAVSMCGAVATAFGPRAGDTTATVAALAGLMVAVYGYLLVPSVLGLVVVAGFGVASILGLVDAPWAGIALLAFGAGWFALAWSRRLVAEWAGYLLGGMIAVCGAQLATAGDSPWRPGLTALVGVLCLTLYARRREPVLVLGGAAAIACAVVQAVASYTGGGPAMASLVLAIGVAVLTGGVIVLLLRPGLG